MSRYKPKLGRPPKELNKQELKFAKLLAEGMKPVHAARKVFKWKCEYGTPENQRAKDLARSDRIQKEIDKIEQKMLKEAAVENFVESKATPDLENLHTFAFERLKTIRDDPANPATVRFKAIEALEKLADPASDLNLIYRYVDLIWGGMTAHCPSCHESFPLWKVKNEKLEEWRLENGTPEGAFGKTFLDRRLYLISQVEKRLKPHKTQTELLASPERHLIAMGAGRVGKSTTLAMFGIMFFLIPGVEVWILGRIYEHTRSELEFIKKFLRTAFYPVENYMYEISENKQTGEAVITSKWGSEVRIKSSKAVGSITARETEAILVAEPGWITGDIFEEVRARLSSRLGRLLAMGTPKGYGGFLGRLVRMTCRDMRTGKRLADDARLIAQGCPWSSSICKVTISPEDNPSYVQSELKAARAELTDTEYASEFEGLMVEDANAKFPYIKEHCLTEIKKEEIEPCAFILGVDQGERNFASCLLAWDGSKVYVLDEYFDNTDTTIKANLVKLNKDLPSIIRLAGGDADNWKLTIFDADPLITGQLYEMVDENREWKSDYTFRPKNKKEFMNWRDETCMWVNELAKAGKLVFDANKCEMLYEQLQEALIRPQPESTVSNSPDRKCWLINDPWRGEHVPDAWLMAMWTLYAQLIVLPSPVRRVKDVYEEARMAFNYRRKKAEEDELRGLPPSDPDPEELYRSIHGGPKGIGNIMLGVPGHYADES